MGCEISRILLQKESERGKGEEGGPLPDPPPPAPLDPRIPLTTRQRFMINSSWRGIRRAIEPTGITMFVKLFEDNAEILNLFGKFKELQTRDEQAESLELAEHANVVMSSIDEGIRAMDNVDFFFDLLHQIGASHRRLPGFKKEYFWKIEKPFLEAVKLTLDERYSENIEKVYKITIRFILETVIKGYDLAEANDNDPKDGGGSGGAAAGSPNTKAATSPSSPTARSIQMQETVNSIRANVKGGGGMSPIGGEDGGDKGDAAVTMNGGGGGAGGNGAAAAAAADSKQDTIKGNL